MFNVGSQELLVVLLLVFLLFGPRHIPGVAHALGKGLGDLRRAMEGVEASVRRAGGDLPRIPRDLDDLDPYPARKPMRSIELPGEVEPLAGAGLGPSGNEPPASDTPQEGPGGARP